MQNKSLKEKQSLIIIYFICAIFLFTTASEAYNYLKVKIDIKYSYLLIFSLLIFVFLFNIREIKIDYISFLLFVRIIIFIITLLLNSNSISMMPRFLAVFICFFSYTIFNNLNISEKTIMKLISIIFVVISVQTITAAINAMNLGLLLNNIKVFIRIPLGGSNYISCFLIMLLPYVVILEGNNLIKYIISFIGIVSIILTRSNTGFIMLIIFISILVLKLNMKNKIIKLFMILCGLLSVILIIYNFNEKYFDRYISVFSNLLKGNSGNVIIAFNGRFQLYQTAFTLIKENFVFGLGVNYVEKLGQLAHNIILESLLQAGILNLIVLIIIFVLLYKKTYKFSSNICLATKISIFLVLLNGMIEPNLFAYNFDYFFWGIVGYSLNRINFQHNNCEKCN